ncbi:unnamed protein product, partial [Mesorhabditis belari]|uniref:CRAL-TRIO domain-containing protein n=1 Tax=Mesorhabditis belari TaxID=2138241 RepID=A0AAF3JBR0_9BILA
MTKSSPTPHGQPLTKDAKHLVSGKTSQKEKEIIETASKALNNHLRFRKALDLDTEEIVSFDENPIFVKRLMPKGEIQSLTDQHNRLLWYIDYASITVESIAHTIPSTFTCKCQFWQFEQMLRRVMEHEEKTGKFSSLRHIIDLDGYDLNPFTMLFLSSGAMAYYTQLFHFEHYPELVSPCETVNIPGWVHMPYKLIRGMMPAGFTDRFKLYDKKFLDILKEEIDVKNIPVTLGGENKDIRCVPAIKVPEEKYWQPTDNDILAVLESFPVPARRARHFIIEAKEGETLSWYFRTDGDLYFGVFYQPSDEAKQEKDLDSDSMELVYPFVKVAAKLVHERDTMKCLKSGR